LQAEECFLRWSRMASFARRPVVVGLAGAAVLLLAIAAVIFLRGGLEQYGDADGMRSGTAPAWTRPCWGHPARTDRPVLAPCAKARGTVLFSRPEGEGLHLIVAGGRRVFVVKIDRAFAGAPSTGSFVTAIGPLLGARNGMREVEAFSVDGRAAAGGAHYTRREAAISAAAAR
jgi:hypothetical protein